jgi:hypothetical protein
MQQTRHPSPAIVRSFSAERPLYFIELPFSLAYLR